MIDWIYIYVLDFEAELGESQTEKTKNLYQTETTSKSYHVCCLTQIVHGAAETVTMSRPQGHSREDWVGRATPAASRPSCPRVEWTAMRVVHKYSLNWN